MHFGLGDVATVDHVEIHWPSGAAEQLKLSAVDGIVTMEEGKGMSTDLCRDCGAGKVLPPGRPVTLSSECRSSGHRNNALALSNRRAVFDRDMY